MARTPSVILTPAERKAQITELKTLIKNASAQIKALVTDKKVLEKTRTTGIKKLDQQAQQIINQYTADEKILSKELVKIEKSKTTLEAQLSALVNDPTPMKAVSVPVDTAPEDAAPVVARRTRRTKAEMEAFRAGIAA